MAKPVGELVQDYVDMKLGCGGVVMAAGAILAAIYMIPRWVKSLLANLKESWLYFLPFILMLIMLVLMFVVYAKSRVNSLRKGGVVLFVGGVALGSLGVSYFKYNEIGSGLMGGFSIVMALVFIGLGCFFFIKREE